MHYTIYELLCFFVIYSLVGWCSEVTYATLESGKFINRGFLNGPVCPIYGFGIILVVICLTPLKEHILILFAGSILLTTALEYITGFVLEKIFHEQWWDYSEFPFNIKGYVCLKFSILWGIACVLVMNVIHPFICRVIASVPMKIGRSVLTVLLVLFAVDTAVTIAAILNLKKRLRLVEEIGGKLKAFSNGVGDNITDGLLGVLEKGEEWKESIAQFTQHQDKKEGLEKKKKELEELKEKYKALRKKMNRIQKRLYFAFPKLKLDRYITFLDKKKKGKGIEK